MCINMFLLCLSSYVSVPLVSLLGLCFESWIQEKCFCSSHGEIEKSIFIAMAPWMASVCQVVWEALSSIKKSTALYMLLIHWTWYEPKFLFLSRVRMSAVSLTHIKPEAIVRGQTLEWKCKQYCIILESNSTSVSTPYVICVIQNVYYST